MEFRRVQAPKNSSAGATAGNFADSPARVDQFTGNSYRATSPEDSEQVLRAIRLTTECPN